MKHNNKRPRFLSLWQIRLPIAGFVSILHRVSGVFLLLLLPFLLYLLQLSLSSAEGFTQSQDIMESWPVRILGLLLLWMFIHHLFAGIRVLLIDLEWGSELIAARRSAWLVMIAALLVVIGGTML
ncbi:MAG: succinate dehydrogenase, cytochrome b556 subunit [Pseudomonadota bacterium]